MQRGDDPDRTRRGNPDVWQTGNRRRGGARRADDDPATRRTPGGPGDATRRVPPPPGPAGRPAPPPGQDATRRVGPPQDATRRTGPGDDATRRAGGPAPAHQPPRQVNPDATRMMPAPVTEPELLGGRYRLEGLLGQGGMADVHRATDTRLNRPVAVKIFGPGNDPTADQRFEQEAQVMANLHHPGLVGVYDFAVEPQRAYLVMELVDGPSLKDVIAAEDLPPEDIARIGAEVAQALAYVHAQDITHRDVKPSNILVDAQGRARLTDFGIASLLGADGHTAVGEIIGTPAYLSPEQVRGSGVGPPTDVYALGLVLLEAWTGRREYQGDGLQGAAERVNRPPVVPADVPEPLRSTIVEATATDPYRRPDARRVAEMLEPGPAPVAAVPEPVVEPERVDQGSSGTGKWIAIGAFVVALLVLLLGYLLLGGGDDEQTPAPASTESSAPSSESPTSETTTSQSPTSEDGGGITIPTELPSGIPTGLPSGIPTELPSGIPTELPSLPSLPDTGQIGQDAQGFWNTVTRWWQGVTGG